MTLDNTRLLLTFLIIIYFIKGLFFASLFPIFQGPDEQIHYATVQYFAEPKNKTWEIINFQKYTIDQEDISTFHFSEELIKTAIRTQFDEIKHHRTNSLLFTDDIKGVNENEIITNSWKRYNDVYPPTVSGDAKLYYFATSLIERSLSHTSIFTRFFSIRIFSVILGALIVLLAYFTARKIGFSEKVSLLLSAIISFHPMFSFMSAIINPDILLIFSFTLFLFGAVSLLRDQLSWKNVSIIIIATLIAFFAKGPGVLLIPFAYFVLFVTLTSKFHLGIKKSSVLFAILSLFLGGVLYFSVPKEFIAGITHAGSISQFSSQKESLLVYIDKTISQRTLIDTEKSYWGNFGWLDAELPTNVIEKISLGELLIFIGTIFLLLTPWGGTLAPKKRFVFLFVVLIVALQVGIRFYDWRVFDATEKIYIGTPGRYFLPNIVPHFLLLAVGLATFARKEYILNFLLKTVLIFMIGLNFYATFTVIIPRYYL